jgi:hypothetical protein
MSPKKREAFAVGTIVTYLLVPGQISLPEVGREEQTLLDFYGCE